MSEIIGQYQLSLQAFEEFEWHGRSPGKKFAPTKAKTAFVDSPEQVLSAAAEIEITQSQGLAELLEQVKQLNQTLESLVGRTALISNEQGWRDGAQRKERLFSPRARGKDEKLTRFQIENRERQDGLGWDTYLAINGLADVYDIWYECYDITSTTMQQHLLRTDRKWGKPALSSRVIRPVSDIRIVDDPQTIQSVTETKYGRDAESMLEEISRYAVAKA